MKQDKMPTTEAHLKRYSHDLSFSRSWTSSTGHIIPVVNDFLNAGETIKCSIDLKTRMQPMLRPSMLEIHQKIKYFFVPMDMIYSIFGAIRYQVNDFFSAQFNAANVGRQSGFPIFNFGAYFSLNKFNSSVNYYSGVNTADGLFDYDPNFLFFDNLHQGCHRLFDALGYDANVVFSGVMPATDIYQPNIFPYALLAYQAVYQNYFRDDDYERYDNQAFNVDNYYQITGANTPLYNLITLRYVNRFKNYFTNTHQSPILGSVSTKGNLLYPTDNTGFSDSYNHLRSANYFLGDYSIDVESLAISDNSLLGSIQPGDVPRTTGFVPSINIDNDVPYQQINASQLRLLFAVDKLMTITGRARKNVDDQVLAHFGFKVPLDVKHNIQYLGEQDGSFSVGDVVSTAETSQAVLGELAGKAFGRVSGSGVSKFTAPVDGVFLGVYYSMPKVRYEHGFMKKNAVADRTDLFIPEFDSLGQQPLYLYECQSNTGSYQANDVVGWQWRYEQYKRSFDTVSWAYRTFGTNPNALNAWSPVMSPLGFSSVPYNSLLSQKVTPHDLDNIMVTPFLSDTQQMQGASGNPSQLYWTDPFLHDMYVDYKKLSTMSTFSIPSLNEL